MSDTYKHINVRISGENYDKRLVRPKQVFAAIDRVYEKGHPPADSVGLGDEVHKHFRWRKGFAYCISGWPGSGKSELINFLCGQRAKKYQTKIAMYTPENYPIEYQVEDLVRVVVEKPIEHGYNMQCSKEELDQGKEFVEKHFRLLQFDDMPNHLDLANEFLRLFEEEGFEMFVIDPFNSILNANNEMMSQYFQAALTQFKMLAANNRVIVVLVEHPRRENLKDGKRAAPSPWILYGGSMWWNKMDIIATIDRDQENNSNVNEFRVWKVKRQRMNGRPGIVDLEYNFATGGFKYLNEEAGN